MQFIALDDRANVIENFCDQVSRNMDATGLQLPPAWTSVRELAEHVWHVNDEELVTIPYVIHLTNELAREDFQSGCIWQEFVDELELIVHSPLDQFEIIPLIPMKIGNLYFSFTNSSLFMLLTLSLVLLLVYFVTKKMKKKK